MNGAPLEGGACRAAPASGRDGMLLDERDQLGGSVEGGHDAEKLTVKTEDERALGPTQPDRVLGQRLEDRLQIERGPPDDLEQLAGRRLLLEGHPQLAIARLQLPEQPDVPDGDDRLFGERLEEGNLLVGKGPWLATPDADRANRELLPEDGHGENGSQGDGIAQRVSVLGVQPRVLEVDHTPVQDRAPRRGVASDRPRVRLLQGGDPGRIHPSHGLEGELPGLGEEHDAEGGVAESARALDDCLEDRLFVGGGARDDAQDLGRRRLLLQGLGEVGVLGLELGEQSCVLDGDGRLIGEGLHQGDLAVGERPDLEPVNGNHTKQLVRPQHRDRQQGPHGVYLSRPVGVLRVGLNVVNVRGAPIEGGARRGAPASGGDRIPLDECYELGGGVVAGHPSQKLTVEAEDERALGLAQPDRVLGQRLEDRLEIEGGPPDHLEQLAGRRLLLEGDPQLAVARLQLGEQAYVRDSDDGLVGKSLKQGDLLVREWVHLGAPKVDRAHRRPFAKQRSDECGSVAAFPSQGAAYGELLGLRLEINYLNGLPVEHGAPCNAAPHDRDQAASGAGNGAVVGGHLQAFRVKVEDFCVVGAAEASGALGHRVQHGLQVRR